MTQQDIYDKLRAFVTEHRLIMQATRDGILVVEMDGDYLTGAGIVALSVHEGGAFYRPAGWIDYIVAYGSADAVESLGLTRGDSDYASPVAIRAAEAAGEGGEAA